MRHIPKNLIRPALMVMPLAFIIGVLAVSFTLSTNNTVLAQDDECDTIAGQLTRILAGNPCPAETPMSANTPTAAEAIQTALAQANAQATAAAANMTATAEANAMATAEAAAMTATAVANAAATAQAIADATAEANMTATAVAARGTATARARVTATAVAEATASAGGAPPPQPRASATPVHTEKVDVTAVEGATTIEPDMQVELMAGNVTVKFPTLSRARTYQAMVAESDECGDMAMACAMVSIYNAEGEMESDVRLISTAEITVTLDADTVASLGGDLDGGAVAIQANALGGIMLQLMDDESGEWNSIPSSFMVNSDGSVTVSGMTRRFSHIALNVYADVVEQARMQVSAALGTPTATPIPPTATPAPPTATPVPPTPTPEPIIVTVPDTGDTSVPPFLMLLAMAVAASMLALVGTKVIMARVRR